MPLPMPPSRAKAPPPMPPAPDLTTRGTSARPTAVTTGPAPARPPDTHLSRAAQAQFQVGNAATAAALLAAPPAVDKPAVDKTATATVDQTAAATGPAAPERPKASQDPKFATLKRDVHAKKRHIAASHPPPKAESVSAQAAARPPADDREAQGKVANADKMNEAKPKPFDKAAFISAVQRAIAERAPKNLEEADQFADSDRPEQVKQDVQGRVTHGKRESASDIATTTAAPPDTSKAGSCSTR